MKISCTLPCSYENLALRTQIDFTVIHHVSPRKFKIWIFFFTFCTLEIVIYTFAWWTDWLPHFRLNFISSRVYYTLFHFILFSVVALGKADVNLIPSLFTTKFFDLWKWLRYFKKMSNTLRPYDDVIFLLVY